MTSLPIGSGGTTTIPTSSTPIQTPTTTQTTTNVTTTTVVPGANLGSFLSFDNTLQDFGLRAPSGIGDLSALMGLIMLETNDVEMELKSTGQVSASEGDRAEVAKALDTLLSLEALQAQADALGTDNQTYNASISSLNTQKLQLEQQIDSLETVKTNALADKDTADGLAFLAQMNMETYQTQIDILTAIPEAERDANWATQMTTIQAKLDAATQEYDTQVMASQEAQATYDAAELSITTKEEAIATIITSTQGLEGQVSQNNITISNNLFLISSAQTIIMQTLGVLGSAANAENQNSLLELAGKDNFLETLFQSMDENLLQGTDISLLLQSAKAASTLQGGERLEEPLILDRENPNSGLAKPTPAAIEALKNTFETFGRVIGNALGADQDKDTPEQAENLAKLVVFFSGFLAALSQVKPLVDEAIDGLKTQATKGNPEDKRLTIPV